jgi:hypothetical protein
VVVGAATGLARSIRVEFSGRKLYRGAIGFVLYTTVAVRRRYCLHAKQCWEYIRLVQMQPEVRLAGPGALVLRARGILTVPCLPTGAAQVSIVRIGVAVRQVAEGSGLININVVNIGGVEWLCRDCLVVWVRRINAIVNPELLQTVRNESRKSCVNKIQDLYSLIT